MRFHGLLLGSLSVILLSSPAEAGRLLKPTPSSTLQRATQPFSSFRASSITAAKQTESTTDFQIARNGLFIRLDSDGDNSKIKIKRSRDRSSIEIVLADATLPATLASQTLPVNSYGVRDIQFVQTSTSPPEARITLKVNKDSPDWQAFYSRFGGLVLLPKGGVSSLNEGSLSQTQIETNSDDPDEEIATIESAQLTNNNTQQEIRADRSFVGDGRWNSREGVYEIRIPNAQLPDSFPELPLDRSSPIYELRLRQENDNTGVILIKPALGFRVEDLSQPDDDLLALELQPTTNQETASAPIPIYVPPPETSTPSPSPETSPSTPLPSVPQGKVVVVIDPGHGGKDPGAIGLGGLRETDVILSISQEVTRLLQQQGVRVMMTRNSDNFVSLQGRTDMANRAGADLFVSIHANSMGTGRPDVSGLEVYYFGNRALANTIQGSILRTVNIKDRGVRRARFFVLRKTSMPATLVEVGFVTGSQDAANLKNSNYRRQMALAIARGIIEHIQQNKL